ncbi:MAG: amidohydrolase family protein [Opitutaceae bacterium]|nr:amidohydrolase family protein [Opitutaceae bacterium]MBP9914084.1 amidohydrolase family protein [Opitutaceae bacterium]
MAPLKLIACDTLVGLPRKPFTLFRPDADDLSREMARLELAAAVVRHRQCVENFPYWGNAALQREAATRPNWIPALCLTPDGAPAEHSLEATMQQAFADGMRIAWISPREHMYSPRPWCSGKLYAACVAARLPLLVDYRSITLDDVEEIMSAYPELRLVLLQVPRLGRHRTLYALLARHPGLYICLSSAYSVHEGLSDLVAEFGYARFLWGSNYPEAEGGASVTLLTYTDISGPARAAIAHGNIERLLAEVRP